MAALSAWQKCDIAFLSYEVSVRYGNKCKTALSANTLTCHTINAKNGANILYAFYNFCIFLLTFDHVAHIISSSWFSGKIFRCFYSTLAKYSLRICCVLKFDHFIRSGKDHIMISYNSSSTYRRDTNLFFFFFIFLITSVIFIFIFSVKQAFFLGLCRSHRCSA